MGTRLRIALLGYRSHPHVGGQGIYLHYLSKALSELGHEVVVFSGPPYPELAGSVRLEKVPGLDLYAKDKPLRSLRFKNLLNQNDMHEWLSKLSGGFAEPQIFGNRLLKIYSKELQSFDVVHDNQSLCFGLLKLQSMNVNTVATIHHPIHRDLAFAEASAKDWFHRFLIRRWYKFLRMQENVALQLNNIITVSEQSKKDIKSHFDIDDKNIKVIPNGIDIDIFRPLEHLDRVPSRIITTASSDQPLKGLHILLKAFKAIHANIPAASLVVIGKLKEQSLAQTTFTQLPQPTKNKITFASNISVEELVKQYAYATVAVCPSLYEGFGMPALEAMACGVPLVSSSGGALPEVVGDAGVLVEANNSAALAQACLNLLHNLDLQKSLSSLALARVKKQFSWKQVAQAYVAFYQSCLHKHVNA